MTIQKLSIATCLLLAITASAVGQKNFGFDENAAPRKETLKGLMLRWKGMYDKKEKNSN
ncbi:MAG: hypothetical protein IH991_14045, partial [Planctomycetes bacterium]|nr:hypothetical protein [Planctomycetota bacterium]